MDTIITQVPSAWFIYVPFDGENGGRWINLAHVESVQVYPVHSVSKLPTICIYFNESLGITVSGAEAETILEELDLMRQKLTGDGDPSNRQWQQKTEQAMTAVNQIALRTLVLEEQLKAIPEVFGSYVNQQLSNIYQQLETITNHIKDLDVDPDTDDSEELG